MRTILTLGLVALLGVVPVAATAQDGFDDAARARFVQTLQGLRIKDTADAGISRLVSDKTHGRLEGIQRVQITPDGTIWLLRRTAVDKLFRAGRSRIWQASDGLAMARELPVSPDGELMVATNRALVGRDGRTWSASSKAPSVIHDLVLTDDGGAWAQVGSELARFDGKRWKTIPIEDIGLAFSLPFKEERVGFGAGGVTGVVEAADGSIWVSAEDRAHRPAGLVRFDGVSWSEVKPFDLDEPIGVVDIAAGIDGSVWMRVVPEGDRSREYLARWAGDDWTGWELPALFEPVPNAWMEMSVLPDGRLWVRWIVGNGHTLLFDGQTWSRLPAIGSSNDSAQTDRAPVPAPDGTLWVTSTGGGYPQAVYIYDLDAVELLEMEPAQAYDPRAE